MVRVGVRGAPLGLLWVRGLGVFGDAACEGGDFVCGGGCGGGFGFEAVPVALDGAEECELVGELGDEFFYLGGVECGDAFFVGDGFDGGGDVVDG